MAAPGDRAVAVTAEVGLEAVMVAEARAGAMVEAATAAVTAEVGLEAGTVAEAKVVAVTVAEARVVAALWVVAEKVAVAKAEVAKAAAQERRGCGGLTYIEGSHHRSLRGYGSHEWDRKWYSPAPRLRKAIGHYTESLEDRHRTKSAHQPMRPCDWSMWRAA